MSSAAAASGAHFPDNMPPLHMAACSSTATPSDSGLHVEKDTPEPAAGMCVVCLDKPASHLAVPCGHQCLCDGCATLIEHGQRQCPICRTYVTQCIRVFQSGWQASERVPTEVKRKRASHSTSTKKGKKSRKRKRSEDEVDSQPSSNRSLNPQETTSTVSQLAESDDPLEWQSGDPFNNLLAEVASLKEILDRSTSSDRQVEKALDRLCTELPTPITEELLSRTLIGRSLNRVSQNEARSAAIRDKAFALMLSWKESVLAARQAARASASTIDQPALGSSTEQASSSSSSNVRGEIQVVDVSMSRVARKRLARHATAARQKDINEPLFVEECIEVDDLSEDETFPRSPVSGGGAEEGDEADARSWASDIIDDALQDLDEAGTASDHELEHELEIEIEHEIFPELEPEPEQALAETGTDSCDLDSDLGLSEVFGSENEHEGGATHDPFLTVPPAIDDSGDAPEDLETDVCSAVSCPSCGEVDSDPEEEEAALDPEEEEARHSEVECVDIEDMD